MYARLTLGERLKDLRVEKHLTLEELSAETGFSSSALGKYEITPRNISHEVIMKLAEYYGVSCDYILGISENKKPLNVEVSELHLNDEMLTMLKEEKINNRLLCEIALHPDFLKLMADIEIYVDNVAAKQIETLNATVDVVRQEVVNKYHPDESDINLKTMEAAHINETEYFFHRIVDDLQPIISEIRNAHKNDDDTDPVNTKAHEILREIEDAAAFPGSDQERQAFLFLKQLGINYNSLYSDEFAMLVNILKKSKYLKSPLSKRGKSSTKKKRG